MHEGQHDIGLVLLSIVVAAATAYVALDLAGRVAATSGRARRRWLVAGACSMGTGVWAMHYIAMLAFSLPVPMLYHVPTVLLSLLAAVAASGVALTIVGRERMRPLLSASGALAMGAGVATMHYLGMQAMRYDGSTSYDPMLVAVSLVVAVAVSFAALQLAFRLRAESPLLAPAKLVAAAIMGLAMAATHYTGMAAAHYSLVPHPHASLANVVGVSSLGIFAVLAGTAMVLALAALAAQLDARLAAQAQAIRISSERYRLLFDRSLAGVYQSTVDGRMVDGNDALAALLGFSSRLDLLTHEAHELYLDRSERERWIAHLRQHTSLPHFEHQLRRHDGALVWVLESASLVASASGESPLIEGTVIDITERKRAEDETAAMAASLATSLERYRTLVETTSAIPWEMDGQTLVFRYVSPMIARLFSYSTEGAIGTIDVWQQVHHDDRDRVRRQFAALAASQAPEGLETEFRIHTGGGRIAHVRSVVTAAASAGDDGVMLRGITLDVTDQKRLEMELQQAQKLESVGRLAAGVAHEINTPVQFVSDSVRFAREGMHDLTRLIAAYRAAVAAESPEALAEARTALAAAEREADVDYLLEQMPQALQLSIDGLERVGTIVSSMKEFAHPDQREMAAVDLNRSLHSTLVVARNEYRYVADVEVDFADLPLVTCHGGELNQAVLNVLVNAAHAIEERVRGTSARGLIRVRSWQDGPNAVIAIEDSGGGIPEAIRAKIYDPFFTTKDVGKGTGQGLAIARSVMVDKHGGAISFATTIGVGTTFYLHLPIHGRPAGVAA